MSKPSPPPSPLRDPAAGGLRREFRKAAPDAATAVLIFAFVLASVSAFAEETGASAFESKAPVAEQDRPVRHYVVWPLIFVDEAAEWRQFSFVPFYVEREASDDSQKRVQFLWPIYMYRRSDRDVSIRVIPFFTYWKDVYLYASGEEYDLDYMLFPIIFGSASTEEGRHFALFPIAGKINHFLGRDEIRFFLFPLYMGYTKGELRQRNYLWPVLSFSGGGDYSGFRLWPLYGYFERGGEYRNEFVLWPIYSHRRFDLDKEQSGERMMMFPIYAREDSRVRRYRSILWPFFAHERNYAANFEERSMPWPFIVITRGDVHRTQVWPLYGYKRSGDRETWFFLWPFWWRQEYINGDDFKVNESLLLPFIYSKTKVSDSGETIDYKKRVWPLWRFHRFEDGSTRFRMLSLLWFADERGFERPYSPLWTIYDRAEEPGGDSQTRALWGLIRHTRRGARTETRIPLLFSRVADTEQDAAETKILGGLIAGVREGGRRKLRLLHFRRFKSAD